MMYRYLSLLLFDKRVESWEKSIDFECSRSSPTASSEKPQGDFLHKEMFVHHNTLLWCEGFHALADMDRTRKQIRTRVVVPPTPDERTQRRKNELYTFPRRKSCLNLDK
mmetsp:Transcript_85684/g.179021  ORF Transcript_85684/g.179021 Transcript_85684/m.179021 type:complete len:109 (-) Transcript_85684:1630-1956(-)